MVRTRAASFAPGQCAHGGQQHNMRLLAALLTKTAKSAAQNGFAHNDMVANKQSLAAGFLAAHAHLSRISFAVFTALLDISRFPLFALRGSGLPSAHLTSCAFHSTPPAPGVLVLRSLRSLAHSHRPIGYYYRLFGSTVLAARFTVASCFHAACVMAARVCISFCVCGFRFSLAHSCGFNACSMFCRINSWFGLSKQALSMDIYLLGFCINNKRTKKANLNQRNMRDITATGWFTAAKRRQDAHGISM